MIFKKQGEKNKAEIVHFKISPDFVGRAQDCNVPATVFHT